MSEAARLWARSILRRHWRATVFLAVFAGLAGGAVMAALDYSRRAHNVVDRRQTATGVPDGTFQSCPPGADPSVDFTPCFQLETNLTALEGLRKSEHVESSTLYVGYSVQVDLVGVEEPISLLAQGTVTKEGEVGEVQILRGRMVDPAAPDELVLNESNAETLRARVGDEVDVAVCGFTFFDAAPTCEPETKVRVVGIARMDSDVLPPREAPEGVGPLSTSFGFLASYEWWRKNSGDQPSYFTTSFRLSPGSTLADVREDLATILPDHLTLVTPFEDVTVADAMRDATQLQGRTLLIVALVLLVAAVVFVGQALGRQVPRELAEHRTMAALGMDRRSMVAVVVLRGVPVAAAAAVVAAAVSFVASAFGPTGLAARAEVDEGLRPDWLVISLGAIAVALFVIGALLLSTRRVIRATNEAVVRRPRALPLTTRRWPPPAQAGVLLGRGRRGGRTLATATLGAAAAVLTAGAAGILVSSLHRLERSPDSYGATWDYGLGEFSSDEDAESAQQRALDNPLITEASMVIVAGPIEVGDVPPFWAVSFTSLRGGIGPRIIEGRAPVADDEIAVGPTTLDALGLQLGETLESLPVLATGEDGGEPADEEDVRASVGPFTVVGVALVATNDVHVGPGKGIVMTEPARRKLDPATGGQLVVRIDPTLPAADVERQLVEEYGVRLTIPNPQSDIRNLGVIANIPWVIAVLVSLLAFAALAHALVTNVRRSRKTIAVLRTLGFTRLQTVMAVVTQATGLSTLALVVGVPLGVAGGVWAWDRRAESLGVVSAAEIPVVPLLVIVVVTLLVANVTALLPGLRAGRDDLGFVLRTE
jgi:hypothetical protein